MKVYQEEICTDCLHALVNGESDHTEEEENRMIKVLEKWQTQNYVPAGLADNLEPFFSHTRCILCNSLPGDRYEYNFFDKS